MPFAQSRGARIHYTMTGGSGPFVVLVQGLGLSSRFWFDALRHPDRVRGLVLFATTPGFGMSALPEAAALGRLLSIPLGGKRAARNLGRLLLPESKWHRAREIFADWPNAMRADKPSAATFVAHLVAATTHMSWRQLDRIRCPVVVVTGDSDSLVPRRNTEVLAKRIPGAELEVVHDTGHAVFAEDRDLVRRMVARVEDRYSGRS